MPTASPIDLFVVIVYLAAVTVIGCLMARRTTTSEEFMSAGGSLPGWVVGLSIVGTFVSSISFIGNPAATYGGTWLPFVFALSLPYAALVATIWFVPFFRNCGSLSAYEHLEVRFGSWARVYSAAFNIFYHIGRIGTILYLVSIAVSALLSVPVEVIIPVLGVLVIAYTLLGGIEAVIWTDVIQSIILVGGMLVCLAILLMRVPDGFVGIIEGAQSPELNKLSLGSLDVDFSRDTFWTMLIFGFFINLQNFAADQTFVQRYFTARSEADARRSVWLGALAYIPIGAVLFFIGTGLFVFYQSAGTLPEGTDDNGILPYFIISELPQGVAGMLIAAILAAAMSTVDSSLNSSSTLLLCDIHNRFFVTPELNADGTPIKDDRGDLRFLRQMTVLLGILGIAVALALIGSKGMLDVWWKISGVLSGGTLGLILLARFTKATGSFGALVGVVAGILCIASITLAHPKDLPEWDWLHSASESFSPIAELFASRMAIVVGTVAVFVMGLLLSRRAN